MSLSRRKVLTGGAAALAAAAVPPLPALGDGMTNTITMGTDWSQCSPDQIVRDIETMMKVVAEVAQIPQRFLMPTHIHEALMAEDTRRIEDERRRDESRGSGYTGDACANCGNFNMRRAGSCLFCESCGETTGCS